MLELSGDSAETFNSSAGNVCMPLRVRVFPARLLYGYSEDDLRPRKK